MEEIVKVDDNFNSFCAVIFVDLDVKPLEKVYDDIQNKYGHFIRLERQDNWCLLKDNIYAIENSIELKEDDIRGLFTTAIKSESIVFLIAPVNIQLGIGFNTRISLLKYLILRAEFNKIYNICYNSSFIYLLTSKYESYFDYVLEPTYIAIKSRVESLGDAIYYYKTKKDYNNYYTRLLGIKYKYFDPNPKAEYNASKNMPANDCIVRAIVGILNSNYKTVYSDLSILGSNYGLAMNNIVLAGYYLRRYGYKMYETTEYLSVGQLIKENSNIKMLISNDKHILYYDGESVCDNDIYETDMQIVQLVNFVITKQELNEDMFDEYNAKDYFIQN